MPQKDLVSLCVSAGTFSCQGLSVLICIRLCVLIRRNGVRNSLRASQYLTLLLLLYLMAAAIKKQLKHKWVLTVDAYSEVFWSHIQYILSINCIFWNTKRF